MQKHDPAFDTLLDLDGLAFVVDPQGGYWVKFEVTRVPATAEKPDEYRDAATLLADFWTEVDAVLKERGVLP